MKTNKSYTKRLKITKSGKLLARKGGQNHFKAKKSRSDQLDRKRWNPFILKNKKRGRFLPSTKKNK